MERGGLLLERFVRADPAEFDHLVALHQDRVTRLAYRLLGWSNDVDDVVQDVFLAALNGFGAFRGEADVATWLTTITVNKCRTHQRRLWLRARWFAGVLRGSETVPAASQATDFDACVRVRQAVQALPARYREVVVLRYLEEMPAARIAEVLGISLNGVEVRLHRARARLKVALAPLPEKRP